MLSSATASLSFPSGDQRPGLAQTRKLGPRHRVGRRQPAQARNGGPVWEQEGYTEGRAPKRPVGAWPGWGRTRAGIPSGQSGLFSALRKVVAGGGCG